MLKRISQIEEKKELKNPKHSLQLKNFMDSMKVASKIDKLLIEAEKMMSALNK